MNIYDKKENETDYEYGLRLIETKIEQKPEDLEWSDIVDLLDLDIHKDTLRKAASTSPYSGYAVMQYYKKKLDEQASSGNFQIDQKLDEIYNATIKLRDERNELNRIKRDAARKESLLDNFKKIIAEEVKPITFTEGRPAKEFNQNDLIVTLSDLHYGLQVENVYNIYSPTVAGKRLSKYLEEIQTVVARHNPENCYLFLGGDLINGAIRSTTRISNVENVIEQVKNVSILITFFISNLSKLFKTVEVYSVPGNHSRIFQNKEDNQLNEYLDNLVPFYLRASLQNFPNIHINTDDYCGELCEFTVRNHKFVGVHGHHDTVESVVANMQKMTDGTPDVILMGHRHQNSLRTINKVKVVESGSFSSMDDYCMEKRLVGYPEQVVLVVSEEKCIECFYDIQL